MSLHSQYTHEYDIYTKKPYISMRAPKISAKKPNICAKEPHLSAKSPKHRVSGKHESRPSWGFNSRIALKKLPNAIITRFVKCHAPNLLIISEEIRADRRTFGLI